MLLFWAWTILWKIISRYYTVMLCSFAMICVFLSGLWFWELQKLHNTHSADGQWITMAKRSRHQLVHLSDIYWFSGRDWVRRWERNVPAKSETQSLWCKLTWLVAAETWVPLDTSYNNKYCFLFLGSIGVRREAREEDSSQDVSMIQISTH